MKTKSHTSKFVLTLVLFSSPALFPQTTITDLKQKTNIYSSAQLEKLFCGHAPSDIETKRLIHIDHLIINWLNENVTNCCKN